MSINYKRENQGTKKHAPRRKLVGPAPAHRKIDVVPDTGTSGSKMPYSLNGECGKAIKAIKNRIFNRSRTTRSLRGRGLSWVKRASGRKSNFS